MHMGAVKLNALTLHPIPPAGTAQPPAKQLVRLEVAATPLAVAFGAKLLAVEARDHTRRLPGLQGWGGGFSGSSHLCLGVVELSLRHVDVGLLLRFCVTKL